MVTMPHCDQRVLHAPGECEFCDEYPEWQEARRLWGIAFTGRPPTDEQPLPCPSELHRDLSVINEWPGNRPSPAAHDLQVAPTGDRPGRPKMPPSDFGEDWWSAHSPTQLGRPNIPVLRRELEAMIRDIVTDIIREDAAHKDRDR